MADRPDNTDYPTGDEELDDRMHNAIVREFARLEDLTAPDVWSRVNRGAGAAMVEMPPNRHSRGRWVLAAAAVVVALGAAVLGGTLDRDQDAVVIAAQGTAVPLPTSTETAVVSLPAPKPPTTECDNKDIAARIGRGMPSFQYAPSESLQSVIARSPAVVRGEISSIEREASGSLIRFTVFGTLGDGDEVKAIWIPATEADPTVNAGFVAFLAGVADAGRQAETPVAWVPHIEGFWVSCNINLPASSALFTPVGDAWNDLLDGGATLDDLWQAAHFPDGEVVTELSSDITEDGSAIYDLQLVTGDRLRLAVPVDRVGAGLRMVERLGPEPIVVSGVDLTIKISFPQCPKGPDDRTFPDLGPEDEHQAGIGRCWASQPLYMELVTPDSGLAGFGEGEVWDLRVIRVGARYGPELAKYWPYDPNCSSCPPTGPLRFNRSGGTDVIVHTLNGNQVTAVASDKLETLWTVPYNIVGGAGLSVQLHGHVGKAIVDVLDGPLVALDPDTGIELWRIDRQSGERAVGLSSHTDDLLLVRSSFPLDGDEAASVLRRIDASTGEVVWETLGTEGTEWAPARPEVFDDVVIMLEDGQIGADEGAGRVWAFDLDTGAPIWSQALFGPGDSVQDEAIAKLEFEDGTALVLLTAWGDAVRLDPREGQIIFRTDVGAASISGTEFATDGTLALALDTEAGLVLLDPVTGVQESG